MKETAKLVYIIIFISITVCSKAQSDISMATHWYNRANYNPASIARTDYAYIFSNYNRQWIGVDGAPKVFNVQASEYFHNIKSAFGLSFVCDNIGLTNSLNPMATYAYRLAHRGWSLSMGLSAGLFSRSLNSSLFDADNESDPALPYENEKLKKPDANIGFEFQSQHFIIGLSSTHLYSLFTPEDILMYSNHRYGYFIYKSNAPSLFNYSLGLQAVNRNNTTIMQGNILLRFKQTNGLLKGPTEKFDLGLTFTSTNQLIALVGMNITPDLRIGYAYDQSYRSAFFANSTHEIMIEYRIPSKASSTKTRCGDDLFWYR